MADNTVLNAGTGGDTIASDDIAGIKHQRVKLSVGADGSASDAVPVSAGMDVTGAAVQAVGLVAQFDDTATAAVTENQFAPVRLSTRRALLVEGVASGTAQPVSAASLPLPTGAATEAKQDTQVTHLAALAGAVAGTEIQADVLTLPNVTLAAGTNTNEVVGDAAHDAAAAGNPLLMGGYASAAAPAAVSLDGDAVRAWYLLNGAQATVITAAGALIGGDAANGLDVDVTRSALPSGASTLAEQQTQTASLSVLDDWDETDRAKVNIIVGQAGVAAGAGAVGATVQRVTLASDDPAVASLSVLDDWDNAASDGASVSGDVAHDAVDAGEPVKIGGRADTTFQTAVADGDRVAALFDVYGVQSVRGDHPNKWSYHENSSSALTDASVQSAPGAGLSVYVTDIIISTGAATALNIFLEESTTTIIGPYYLEAVAGRSIHIRFATPKKCTANTAITVTTSAAIAHGLDILGFIAP